MHVVELDNKFAIWIKHKKTKTRSVVALPLTKTLHEILAIHLKEWSHDKKNMASPYHRPCHKI